MQVVRTSSEVEMLEHSIAEPFPGKSVCRLHVTQDKNQATPQLHILEARGYLPGSIAANSIYH